MLLSTDLLTVHWYLWEIERSLTLSLSTPNFIAGLFSFFIWSLLKTNYLSGRSVYYIYIHCVKGKGIGGAHWFYCVICNLFGKANPIFSLVRNERG